MRKMVYLASPYSGTPWEQHQRFLMAWRATLWGWKRGCWVFSPVVYTHPLEQALPPIAHEEWLDGDKRILELCDELWVLTIDGWDQSRGVQEEVDVASRIGIPVRFIGPDMIEDETIPDWDNFVELLKGSVQCKQESLDDSSDCNRS